MLSCRGVGSPARRAPLRGERSWRRATAAQRLYNNRNCYLLLFCLFLYIIFYYLIYFMLLYFISYLINGPNTIQYCRKFLNIINIIQYFYHLIKPTNAHTCTYIHTYIHIIYRYIYIYIHTYTHAHASTHVLVHVHYMHHIHAHTYIHT